MGHGKENKGEKSAFITTNGFLYKRHNPAYIYSILGKFHSVILTPSGAGTAVPSLAQCCKCTIKPLMRWSASAVSWSTASQHR